MTPKCALYPPAINFQGLSGITKTNTAQEMYNLVFVGLDGPFCLREHFPSTSDGRTGRFPKALVLPSGAVGNIIIEGEPRLNELVVSAQNGVNIFNALAPDSASCCATIQPLSNDGIDLAVRKAVKIGSKYVRNRQNTK